MSLLASFRLHRLFCGQISAKSLDKNDGVLDKDEKECHRVRRRDGGQVREETPPGRITRGVESP
jgi:hypothetical protein